MAMNELLSVPVDGFPLLDAVAKATLLIAGAGLTTFLLRRASAAARHLVWTSALLAALALPAVSLVVPRWQVPLVTLPQAGPPAASAPAPAQSSPMAATMASRLGGQRQAGAPIDSVVNGPTSVRPAGLPWTSWLLAAWAAGALMILARLFTGLLAVHLLARTMGEATHAPWLPLARELAAGLGLSRVSFRRSAHPSMTMPMAWGVIRPAVALPAEADRWSRERLRIVLLHELAHVKRADCLTHLLAQVACAVYWMNPLAWIAARRARSERERACDDLVLAAGTRGTDYADLLLDIARGLRAGRFSSTVAAASLAMAHHSQLEGRLMAILDPTVPRTGVSRFRTAAVTGVAVLIIVPLASLQTWTHAEVLAPPAHGSGSPLAWASAPAQEPPVRTESIVREAVAQSTAVAIEEATKDAIREAVRPAAQDVIQEVMQSIPDAVTGTLNALFQSNPNPNPNPMPQPARKGSGDSATREQGRKTDPKVVAALTEALKDSDKEVREAAMQALVRMRDPGVFEPLVQSLRDASADVREQAAFGLGQMRDRRAVAPLTAALKDAEENVREQAAFALGQIGDAAAVDALVPALKDAHANVREQAAFALGQLRAATAVDGLIAALRDADVSVREQSAFALGQIGDARAVDALTAALKDASSQVRQQAAFALGQLAR